MPAQPTCAAPFPFAAVMRRLIRAQPEVRATVDVFEPLKPEIERLTRGIKSAFDPSGFSIAAVCTPISRCVPSQFAHKARCKPVFPKRRLDDPQIAEADRILRRWVHCGFCIATCPTYVVLGDERDSPRGRIYAIKDMLEKGLDAKPEVSAHIDRCLSCFSCMTTCPSGVDYMHLVEIAREHIEKTGSRSLKDRLIRRALTEIVPYPRRFRWAMRAAPLGRRLSNSMRLQTSGTRRDGGPGAPRGAARGPFSRAWKGYTDRR